MSTAMTFDPNHSSLPAWQIAEHLTDALGTPDDNPTPYIELALSPETPSNLLWWLSTGGWESGFEEESDEAEEYRESLEDEPLDIELEHLLQRAVLSNPYCPEGLWQFLADTDVAEAHLNLAASPACPSPLLEGLSDPQSYHVAKCDPACDGDDCEYWEIALGVAEVAVATLAFKAGKGELHPESHALTEALALGEEQGRVVRSL